MATYVCEQCRESVSESARNCPHCGHDAGAGSLKRAKWWGRIGAILSLTIIGVPFGIPMVIWGKLQARRARKKTVGVPA